MINGISVNVPSEVIDYVFSVMEDYEDSRNPRICIATNALSKVDDEYESAMQIENAKNTLDYQVYRFNGVEYIYGFDFGN